jgi:hypothetical protein
MSETCTVLFQKRYFEKLLHLVGFYYKKSVRYYNYSLSINPEEGSSQAPSRSDIHQMLRFLWNAIHFDSSCDNQTDCTVTILPVCSQQCGFWYESEQISRIFTENVSASINYITFKGCLIFYRLMSINVIHRTSISTTNMFKMS